MSEHETNEQGGARGSRGFSLVEVMIAALLFAVAMIAVLGMQYAALDGFAGARDLTKATHFGKRVIEIARLEAQNWTGENDNREVTFPYEEDIDDDPDDEVDFNASGDDDSILELAESWTWTQVFVRPLDVQLNSEGSARYCAYVRGERMGGSGMADDSLQRIQVAVVYPGSTQSMGATCPDFDEGDLDPTTGNAIEAELEGWRVVHLGAVIRERGFLS